MRPLNKAAKTCLLKILLDSKTFTRTQIIKTNKVSLSGKAKVQREPHQQNIWTYIKILMALMINKTRIDRFQDCCKTGYYGFYSYCGYYCYCSYYGYCGYFGYFNEIYERIILMKFMKGLF
jgi:hypothetical protein